MVTVKDFREFCAQEEINICKEIFLGRGRRAVPFLPNLLAATAIFVIEKK
jgi:hypothetical protein